MLIALFLVVTVAKKQQKNIVYGESTLQRNSSNQKSFWMDEK
jgi:hypothetical protein